MADHVSSSGSANPPLLVPYRAVGLVSDGVPFAVSQLGTETFVTTAVGRAFQVYQEQKLRLAFAGPQLPRAITALCTEGELTVAAGGSAAHVYRRAELVCTCEGEHTAPVRHLLMMGESTLLTVCEAGVVIAWSLPAQAGSAEGPTVVRRLHAGFSPLSICHPATYLNKILLGGSDGRLQLWNVRSGTKVHEFAGWGAAVLCVEQSPALDVCGIGHADGRIILHHLKKDRSVLQLSHEEGDACTALAFRTDGQPLLVSGSSRGSLHVWHLERRVRLTSMPAAHHNGAIASLHFVRGQPHLLSLGASDNALKEWTFDRPDGGGRLLRSRSGHSAPPSVVRFHSDSVLAGGGPAGQATILSGGADRTVRQSSIWSAQQDCELSQRREESKHSMHVAAGSLERRLPPLADLVTSQVRERDWSNVLSSHQGCTQAYTWDTTTRALGPHTLQMQPSCAVTAVAISACGHFGFLGGESGRVDKFNLQSGQRRSGTSPADSHSGAVRGLCPEALNRSLFSGGFDGFIRTFKPSNLSVAAPPIEAGAPISFLRHQRDSPLLAAACDDLTVRIFDTVVGRLVRNLTGHTNTLTDAAWSADGRWVFSTSLDATIRISDVPSGQTIGWYRLDDPPTSIAVAPQGEYIATSHASTNAVCVWANRAFFSSTLVSACGDEPQRLEMPVACDVEGEDDSDEDDSDDDSDAGGQEGRRKLGDDEEDDEEEDEEDEEDEEAKAAARALSETDAKQLGSCITLSELPVAHIRTIVHLQTIQKRNLPAQPPTAPKAAPFFLPTVQGLTNQFVTAEEAAARIPGGAAEGRDDKRDREAELAAAAAKALDGGDHDDGWGALEEEAEEVTEGDTAVDGGNDGVGEDGDDDEEEERRAKRARRSRVLSLEGEGILTPLQSLLRAASVKAEESANAAAAMEAVAAGAKNSNGGGHVGSSRGSGRASKKATAKAESAAATAAAATAETARKALGEAHEAITAHLLSLTPNNLDLEIRSVGSGHTVGGAAEGEALDEFLACVEYLGSALSTGRAYELLQASLCVFLRVHQETLVSTPALAEALRKLHAAQEGSWGELKGALHRNLCLLSHFCRTQS